MCALLCKPSSGRTSKTKKAVMTTLSLSLFPPFLYRSLSAKLSHICFSPTSRHNRAFIAILLNHKCFISSRFQAVGFHAVVTVNVHSSLCLSNLSHPHELLGGADNCGSHDAVLRKSSRVLLSAALGQM